MGAKLILKGKKFGKLIVLSENGKNKQGGINWLCKCDCNNIITARSSNLVQGLLLSCGCLEKEINKRKDRVGEVFGRLTIIGLSEINRKIVIVKCSCGVEKKAQYYNLKSGHIKSCGCLKLSGLQTIPRKRKPSGEVQFNSIYKEYKNGALNRNLSFNLTEKEFFEITQKDCYYCSIPPYRERKNYRGDDFFIYNGIDRVNNKIGYEINNVEPCCKHCNRAKDTMSKNDFISLCIRVSNKFKKDLSNDLINSALSIENYIKNYKNKSVGSK